MGEHDSSQLARGSLTSAWICIAKSEFVNPPSTLRISSLTLLSASMTSRTARVWKHTASSVARAI